MSGPNWKICATLSLLPLLNIGATPQTDKVISSVDLDKPFHAHSAWRLTATQGPQIKDDIYPDGMIAGKIRLCLHRAGSIKCDPVVSNTLTPENPGDYYGEPHYLEKIGIVYARTAARSPLLILKWSGPSSGDGSHGVMTQALTYDASNDQFRSAYRFAVGSNRNEEIRFIAAGRLRGAIISAEPTDDAPYGYWVTVNRSDNHRHYRQVLRYRSATHYGDGNPLAVIDSEMPNIQKRLGLWKPGQKLPLPQAGCLRPRLVHSALWCS